MSVYLYYKPDDFDSNLKWGPHPRYYRMLNGCGTYFCPIRKTDAVMLIKHGGVYWTDNNWVLGGVYWSEWNGVGRIIQITDLRQASMNLLNLYNSAVIRHGAQLDPQIDMSVDRFNRIHRADYTTRRRAYEITIKAAKQKVK